MTISRPSYPSLSDQVVFVNGGSSGIGAEIVQAFAMQGAKVGFSGRSHRSAQTLIGELDTAHHLPAFFPCDAADIDSLQAAIRECSKSLGDIAVLINNVANDDRHDIEAVDVAYFDWMANINLRPHVFAIQSVIGGMRRLGSGAIINLGSIAPKRKNDGAIIYTAMKAAIHG